MDQHPDTGNIRIENAFNGASQNAIGHDAQVNIGTPGEKRRPDAIDNRSLQSGNIAITHSFNNASMIALGENAQVNVHARPSERGGISGQASSTEIGAIAPYQSTSSTMQTCNVFISYSYKDRKWFTILKAQLAVLERQKILEIWDASRLVPGTSREQAISNVLSTANVAVLLVSAHFLASDFIGRYELPRLLERHAHGQLFLLPLIVSPCLYQESPLGQYLAFNPMNKPLSALSSSQAEEVFVQVVRTIQKALEQV